jgi:hypothetical protein
MWRCKLFDHYGTAFCQGVHFMPLARPDRLVYVKMKARRADEHFRALDAALSKWAEKP